MPWCFYFIILSLEAGCWIKVDTLEIGVIFPAGT